MTPPASPAPPVTPPPPAAHHPRRGPGTGRLASPRGGRASAVVGAEGAARPPHRRDAGSGRRRRGEPKPGRSALRRRLSRWNPPGRCRVLAAASRFAGPPRNAPAAAFHPPSLPLAAVTAVRGSGILRRAARTRSPRRGCRRPRPRPRRVRRHLRHVIEAHPPPGGQGGRPAPPAVRRHAVHPVAIPRPPGLPAGGQPRPQRAAAPPGRPRPPCPDAPLAAPRGCPRQPGPRSGRRRP